MGTFQQTIELAAAPGGPFVALQATVDTGSLYAWVPATVLQRLGVAPRERRAFLLADGTRILRDVAWVETRVGEHQGPSLFGFGDEGSLVLLGDFTVEGFGLAAHPANKRLVPMDVIPALTLLPTAG